MSIAGSEVDERCKSARSRGADVSVHHVLMNGQ